METDVLIVGGGPAGLHAAYVAASNGAKTVVVDESFSLGGQLRQQTQSFDNLPKQFERQSGTRLAQELIERLVPLNVTTLLKHTMIGVYKDGRVGVSNGSSTIPINAKKIIVTTGAAEEASVFPGWTLPGVMTVGAAQILLNREHVHPGKNAFILGSNTFSLEVAKQLTDASVTIQGIIESENKLHSKNVKVIQQVKDAGLPIYLNSSIVSATGLGEVDRVILNDNGVEVEFDIDLVCIGAGVTPILEPFEILNCSFMYQEGLGGWVPQYDKTMETSTPSIYVAGNAAGITCMGAIMLSAEIATINSIEVLGILDRKHVVEKKESLWKELHRIESNEIFKARIALMKESKNEKGLPFAPFSKSD